ncbi:MAG TPA: YciI family protein [Casimicrobiaceae bacterium]|nr:YciI family protein [Casimicrobiaceae bacterium]
MEFMLLILEPHGQRAARTEAEGRDAYDRMLRYADTLQQRGVLRAAQSLRTDTEGVRVSLRQGRRTLVDGPFSESKEMIGGYFLVECASRDEAVEIAADIPAAQWATVEVREFGPCFI